MEPHDRLERSSPGYGPGASPSTLAGQGTAATPPGDRRLADVRHAVCRRVFHPPPPRHLVTDPDPPAYQAGVTGSDGWRREVATRSMIAEGGPAHAGLERREHGGICDDNFHRDGVAVRFAARDALYVLCRGGDHRVVSEHVELGNAVAEQPRRRLR